MMHQTKVPESKVKEVAFLKENIAKYGVVGLVSMEKISSKAVQEIRAALRGRVVMRMAKKRLMKRALEESNKPNLVELGEMIEGSTAMVFTEMRPRELSSFLEKRSAKAPAKAGDIAPIEILVKKGDTHIAPGPIISELNTVLKLPTMIKDGMIHIREDTVTHKPGDMIDLKQSILLGRLGIEPMTVSLEFYAAWENGEIVPQEVLKLDEGKIISDVEQAHAAAFNLAIALELLTEDTVAPLVAKASRAANALAVELEFITPDTIPLFLGKAASVAASINNMVFGSSEEAAPAEEAKDEKKDDKEKHEDDDEVMGAGIGALFG